MLKESTGAAVRLRRRGESSLRVMYDLASNGFLGIKRHRVNNYLTEW